MNRETLMGYEHFFTAPDGTELAVITRDELLRLRGLDQQDDDAADIAAADRARHASDVRIPSAVVDAMLAGETPIAAWRKHRGISQAELAERAGVTQAAISRLETVGVAGVPSGRLGTRRAIAKALDVSIEALEPLDD